MLKNKTVFLLLLLAGCTAKTIPYQKIDANAWQADGKVGIQYPKCNQYRGCKIRAVNAGYIWQHTATYNHLVLLDPTGQAQLTLVYQNGQVIVTEKDRQEVLSLDELAERLGINLPIAALNRWLINQRPAGKTIWQQDGWQVRVGNWQGYFYRTLVLKRGDYKVHLITYALKPFSESIQKSSP